MTKRAPSRGGATARVSVVLPVYNGERYLNLALESLWQQTMADFEAVVVNDGSTDGTSRILANCRDARLRVVNVSDNMGLVAALNLGIAEARAPLIARFDADDVALPTRLARQVAYLDASPDVVLLGGAYEPIGEVGEALPPRSARPVDDFRLRWDLLFNNVFTHSAVVFRRATCVALGGYRDAYPYAEDYDLWVRLASQGKMAGVSAPVVRYRFVASGISAVHHVRQRESAVQLSEGALNAAVASLVGPQDAQVLRVLHGISTQSIAKMVNAEPHETAQAIELFQALAERFKERFAPERQRRGLRAWIDDDVRQRLRHSARAAQCAAPHVAARLHRAARPRRLHDVVLSLLWPRLASRVCGSGPGASWRNGT